MGVNVNIAIGEPPETKRPFWGKCGECSHCWPVAYLPMDIGKAARLMGKARCPMGCSAKVFIAKQVNGVLQEAQ